MYHVVAFPKPLMKKPDGRTIDHTTLEWIRIKAVKDVLQAKKSPEVVMQGLGLHRTNIYKWLRQHKEGGWAALRSSKAVGPTPILTEREERTLKKMLMKNPMQFSFHFGLWTLEMVQALIEKKLQKEVSMATVGRLLGKIGYTNQKPLMRAYEQNPTKVQEWLTKEFPRIKREAKREKREIDFGDEAGFRSTERGGKTWAKRGKTPVVRVTGKRFGINAISAVSTKGSLRFMLYEGTFTAITFILFLKRMLDGHDRNITLIVDGHPTHKTKAVRDFITSTKGQLRLYILPGYSPELNPDEQVWNSTKRIVKRKVIHSKQAFVAQIRSHLHSLQKNISAVLCFFQHPDVAYVMRK
jgi:transposase